jgi:hypothetical protein
MHDRSMRQPRRDLFGNESPPTWEDRLGDALRTFPNSLQPWLALLCVIAFGVVFIFGLYVLAFGITGLLP